MKLFNKGIYKSVLKRFWWVSVVYFVLLFMLSCVRTLAVGRIEQFTESESKYLFNNYSFILITIIGILFAYVVGILVYKYLYSRKQATFLYSLPIGRGTIFVSSALSGITLLMLPVLLNGAILMILSLGGYGIYFGISQCVEWILFNVLCVFIMFAYSGIGIVLTGNLFASIILNVLIHIVTCYVCWACNSFGSDFLFGYVVKDSDFIWDMMIANNPLMWFSELATENIFMGTVDPIANIEAEFLLVHLGIAIGLYISSAILSIKRKAESVGEIAGFKILKPIFKYGATFLALFFAFSAYKDKIGDGKVFEFVIAELLSGAVVYFIIDAAVKKRLDVWKSYKGFFVAIAAFTLFVTSLMFTSFFGYETRVPDVEDIDGVAVYEDTIADLCVPYVKNEDIKELATLLHKEKISARENASENIYIEYKLKNATTIKRKYEINLNDLHSIRVKLCEYDEYRRARYENIFNGFENVEKIVIGAQVWLYGDNCYEFLECVKKDLIECDAEALCKEEYYATVYCGEEKISFYISDGFDATVKWLKEKGEWQYMQKNVKIT